MAIVYSKKNGELVYYVYKFATPNYGVSVTHRNGETSLVSNFSQEFHDAVGFIDFLEIHKVRPTQLELAAKEYRHTRRN